MKKNILKYLFIIGAGLLAFSSCTEDDLVTPAYGKILQSADTTAPISISDANANILSAYGPVSWAHPWGMSTYISLTVASDEAVSGGGGAADRSEYEGACKHNMSLMNDGPKMLWERFYNGVYFCNKFLEDFPLSKKPNNDSLKRLTAEAKFLRAFYYFHIVNLFGNAPLILDTKTDLAGNSTLVALYDQIEKDLLASLTGLPANRSAFTTDDLVLSRATVGVAKAYLGKVYIFRSSMLKENKWNEAFAQLNAVYTSGDFKLEPNFRKLWWSTNEIKDGNKEFLFTTSYNGSLAHNWAGKNTGNIDIQLCGIRSYVPAKNGYGPIASGWGFLRPTQKIVDAFIAEDDSIRLDETVWDLKKLVAAGAEYSDPYDATGYTARKYSAKEKATGYSFPMDYVYMRFADVILMLAEVEYNRGNEANALKLVNEVRARVKLAPKASSGAALFNDIVKERQLELAEEGVRYWDLIRWGKASAEIPYWNAATNGLWPIHYNDIKSNPDLVQNPGY